MANRFEIFGLAMAMNAAAAFPVLAEDVAATAWDPLEDLNRLTFAFNSAVATAVVPVIVAYRDTLPDAVQTGVDNVFTNLREPVTTLASVLQGDLENAGMSAGRFAVNLVAGIGGIHDAATPLGLIPQPEDMGSTLCSYGLGAGPYIVLPLLGPSTGREALGLAATYSLGYEIGDDLAASYYVADASVAAMSDAPIRRAAASSDFYAEQRDAYLALREDICRDKVPAGELKSSPVGRIIRSEK
jgi:phospholipid-binding lipoprotein MlaA